MRRGPKPEVIISLSGGSSRGRSVDGIVFAASYTEDNPRPRFQDFLRRYQERFGWPANFAAVYAYEAVEVLAAALAFGHAFTARNPDRGQS